MAYSAQEVFFMFRREKHYVVNFSPAEKKLVRFCLMELRNKLLTADCDTDDVDALLRRLME